MSSDTKKKRCSTNERLKIVLHTDDEVRRTGRDISASLDEWLTSSSKTPVRMLAEEMCDIFVKAVTEFGKTFAEVRRKASEGLVGMTKEESLSLQTPEFKDALIDCARQKLSQEKSDAQRKKALRDFLQGIGADEKQPKEIDDSVRVKELEAKLKEAEKHSAALLEQSKNNEELPARLDECSELLKTSEQEKANLSQEMAQMEYLVSELTKQNKQLEADKNRLSNELATLRTMPPRAS